MIGTLTVRIGADVGDLTRGLDSAAQKIGQMGDRLTSAGRTMSTRVTAPIAALGAAALASTVRVGNMADEVLDLSEKTGLSTRSLQEFRRVATVAGVGADTIANAAQALGRRLSATGDESAQFANNMAAIGVEMRDATGALRSMDDMLPEIIRELQGMEDITTRNAIATQIFGRGASELAPILGMAAGEMDAVIASAHEMGLVLSQESLEAANEFRVGWDTMRESIGASVSQIGLALIPIMTDLTNFLQTSVVPAVQAVVGWLQDMSPATQRTIAVVAGLAAAIGPLLLVLGMMAKGVAAVTAGAALLLSPIGLAILAIGSLALAGKALVDNWRIITFEVGRMVDGIRDALVGRFSAIVDSVREKVEAVTGFFRGMYDRVVGNSYVPDTIDGIRDEFARLDAVMVNPALAAVATVQAAFAGLTGPTIAPSVSMTPRAIAERGPSTLSLAMDTLVDELQWAAGAAGAFASRIAHAAASMDPWAALGALAAEVLEPMFRALAPAFEKLVAPLNAVGELFAEVLAPVLEALQPLFDILALNLTALAHIVGIAIAPLLKALAPIIQGVSWALSWLVTGLGYAVRAIGRAINAIPGVSARTMIAAGQSMIDAAEDMRRGVADPVDEATDALNRFTSALTNAPRALNVALLRFNASGVGAGAGSTGGAPRIPDHIRERVGRGDVTHNYTISIDATDRPIEVVLDELERAVARKAARGETTRLRLAVA